MKPVRTFYILTLTQIFSLIGSRMTGIAVAIQVFKDTGNTAPLLTAAFFAELPGMVAGSFTGWIADRFDRRYVMILGDAGQAVGTLLLLVSFASEQFRLWHLFAVVLVQGIFGMIQAPASDATITMLVPQDQRDRANGVRQIGFPLAGVVAPTLAGLFYGLVGIEGVMAFDLLTFVMAVTVVFLMHIPHPPRSSEGEALGVSFWRDLLGGWHYLIERRSLFAMVLYLSFFFFLINGPLDLVLPYAITLTKSETTAGVLLSAMSLGALAGALLVTAAGKIKHRLHWIMGGYLVHGVLLIVFGVVREPLLFALVLFFLMIPLPASGALFNTLLQGKTPPDLQGRVFAITGQLFMLATPFSFLITAALVDDVLEPAVGKAGWKVFRPLVGDEKGAGMGLMLVGTGVIAILSTVLVYAHPRIRHLEAELPEYEISSEADAP